ncbi:TetR/AcrR family transcriptional regulator [Nonomuraea aridisoli]|uniref:TetR/AcrR family transcriptional regulator n=1 Tax=Nonomuraea aridisoli TaxID=2070368 RepID=A0A2W2EW68_9ACTN|nr:TetR/AcrR family transcriptional regulator [Nonomuraea aridisoli]PZG08574.1 TetR/AcrR family transcriptional regulator [Nonomuraea aridisoli]
MGSPEDAGRESILRAATRLFSALSYDGTSMAHIAEAAGLDPSQVSAHFPDKHGIYLEIMGHCHRLISETMRPLAAALRDAPPERRAEAVHRLLDAYVDVCVEHPEVPALWMHRWPADAGDIRDVESRHMQPLIEETAGVTDPEQLRRFRAHLHLLFDRALGLPGARPEAL